jgi:hypothetical protein
MRKVDTWEIRRGRRSGPARTWAIALTTAFLLAAPAHAAGTKLYVATNGVDNADCGPEGLLPCRSISRAIAHASAGDEIIVGPGVYGDINRYGLVDPSGDSGEETPVSVTPVQCPFQSAVNLAMIHVDKPLTIVSRDGAGSTIIDAGGQFPENYIAVNIAADGVVFGKRGKGFTVRNASIGINVAPGVADATVQGNMAECYVGYVVGSCDGTGPRAVGTVLKGNTAAPDSAIGFLVYDDSAVVSGNLAKANLGFGFFVLAGAGTMMTRNLAVDGLGAGFYLISDAAAPPSFSKNAAIGNMDAGVFVIASGLAAAEMTIEKNSFFGNGKRPIYPPENCGLVIQNQGPQPITVHADDNWWGAGSGPGAEPADTAGGACSAGAVILDLTQSATSEIRVEPPTK